MLECVINVSEGRRMAVVGTIARAAGRELLDVHTDPDHNRSVLTVVGPEAARAVLLAATLTLDISEHDGVHPRLGVVDVVPFVPLGDATLEEAIAARDAFAGWVGDELGIPCFCYGPERTLPEVRRRAFVDLPPDTGPAAPHPTAGACCVGARGPLVAYNVWLAGADLDQARTIARDLRSPTVRALGLAVGDQVQVSMNLIEPLVTGPADAYDAVASRTPVARAELVGLIPAAVLGAVDPSRWSALDLAEDRTIEHRLTAHGFSSEGA
jgi:glutamate formiminotransferase/glutamate formiminotransferase/formiminotetrahydrofolate cyclodeaminase